MPSQARPASRRHYDGFFSAFAFFFFFFIAMVMFLWVSVNCPAGDPERRRRCPWAQPLAVNKDGIAVSTAQSKNEKTADISVA
jgi:hypothetical protein